MKNATTRLDAFRALIEVGGTTCTLSVAAKIEESERVCQSDELAKGQAAGAERRRASTVKLESGSLTLNRGTRVELLVSEH